MGEHSHSSSHPSSKKHRSSSRRERDDEERDGKRLRSSRDDRDKDSSRSSSSRHKSSSSSSHRHHHRSRNDKEEEDDDEWVEKDAAPPATALSALPPPPVDTVGTFSVGAIGHERSGGLSALSGGAMTDGYGEGDVGEPGGGGDMDLFSAMGSERKRREPKEKVDPSQMMGQSSRELNKAHWQGVPNTSTALPPSAPPTGSPAPGSSGSAWRMTKLRRTYETAEEEGRPVEEVAMERYGSMELFNEAREERRILDERDERRKERRSMGGDGGGRSGAQTPTNEGRRFMYTDAPGSADGSRPASRGAFRRPGEAPPELSRTSSATSTANSGPSTPVPRVFTPPPASVAPRTPLAAPIARAAPPSALSQSMVLNPDPTSGSTAAPILSQSELNKLQAKVLKARLMGADNADALEAEYEKERQRAAEAPSVGEVHIGATGSGVRVEAMPTLDGRGRLYDVGTGKEVEEEDRTGKRKKKEKFESHDPTTGEVLRQSASDDVSLAELVRQERFSAGASDQKDMDAEMASRIAGDMRYKNDLDYVDENADKLARKKMKSDVMKKAFAVQDYAKTKKALDNCNMCFSDEGAPPRSAVVALGTRAYLGLLENEELVPGHCRIVPIQHHFTTLEADDETWDEIKNFMKTLMQLYAEEDKGVVFFESAINLKHQRHTCIEAVPIPFDLFDEIPAYFSEAIENSEQEWSQHKKRIVFTSARPFRRSLVPNLPYFMVQFDYKGEKGYGHIIEGIDDAPTRDADGEEIRGEFGDQGAGAFPRWFATEIIGSMLELEPRAWRKPRRLDFRHNNDRVAKFKTKYDKYDWTKMLAGSA
ncbi:CwfJ C-terminus 1-domain-containing protein-like protein [Leucosporidium creatinivorum]|uniref:CwfJ C-terminus 1-domain-containing protein-like protein n=1 Tax=Leucosporidium creatinivorum TaxID=106004 RepID=A0A1Y2D9M4_9BASI|nr:CwfJ C-terminus 1-domain-containing protein-like protein [Leucosporidium creatinivorum]